MGVTGQVARGSCADSDADAVAAARKRARVRGKQASSRGAGGRTDGARAGLVVEELLVLAWDGMDAYSFELAAVVTLPPLATGNG